MRQLSTAVLSVANSIEHLSPVVKASLSYPKAFSAGLTDADCLHCCYQDLSMASDNLSPLQLQIISCLAQPLLATPCFTVLDSIM